MFFFTYLRRELRRRMRQAIFIALGLAVGVGLVTTVIGTSHGVSAAENSVLRSLYGVGTDVTVTNPPPPFSASNNNGTQLSVGSNGTPQVCNNGHCSSGAQKIDNLTSPAYGAIPYSTIAKAQKLKDVSSVAGGLALVDQQMTIPASLGTGAGSFPTSNSINVEGVDFSHSALGPLSDGTIPSGRNLKSTDSNANVAVVDSDYAIAHKLSVGSTITIAKMSFSVVGIISQPQGASPPNVYIPLAGAQALGTINGKSLANDVNTIYVTATSASDIPAVQQEIHGLLPAATVTTASSLASEVTGSAASTASLANNLGRWLSVLVLIAAFAVASLLTVAAVARRAREFGTLKALGWRSRRVIAQVLGESTAIGIIGAALGVGIGFAATAIITQVAPKISATVTTASGEHMQLASGSGTQSSSPTIAHTIYIPLTVSVTLSAVIVGVVLALAGALIAGAFGSWRIVQLRPASALSRLE